MTDSGLEGFMLSVEAAIGLLAVLVALPATVYARIALWPPRRQVDISVLRISPIFDMSMANKKLEVEYDGKRVREAHVCSIRIQGTGRYDVSSEQFDEASPIRVNLGVPVLGDLRVESIPEGRKPPNITTSGTDLHIGPSVIAVGQTVDLLLLTDGRPTPSISYSMADTKVTFAVGSSEVQQLRHTQASRANSPPLIVIVGTALGSFGMMSFLILLGAYEILPRPYDLIGPHLILAIVGATMCASARRQFRQSARLGLTICSISLLAIVADAMKTGVIPLP